MELIKPIECLVVVSWHKNLAAIKQVHDGFLQKHQVERARMIKVEFSPLRPGSLLVSQFSIKIVQAQMDDFGNAAQPIHYFAAHRLLPAGRSTRDTNNERRS